MLFTTKAHWRTAALLLAVSAAPALAQGVPGQPPFGAQHWGQYGSPYGGAGSWRNRGDEHDGQRISLRQSTQPSKQIAVTAFRAADAAALLGTGRIVVRRPAGEMGADVHDRLPVYEAAVIDELARRGYDTATAANPGQVAEIGVSHSVAVPEEPPRKKVSGAMSTTIGTFGSGVDMAIAVDLTKPSKAIVATRLDLRIREAATGRVLWEGHAEGEARAGDAGLDNGAIAVRLASALLKRFPEGQVVQPLAAVLP